MSESPYNPVAPALANAIATRAGRGCIELPMTPGPGLAGIAGCDASNSARLTQAAVDLSSWLWLVRVGGGSPSGH